MMKRSNCWCLCLTRTRRVTSSQPPVRTQFSFDLGKVKSWVKTCYPFAHNLIEDFKNNFTTLKLKSFFLQNQKNIKAQYFLHIFCWIVFIAFLISISTWELSCPESLWILWFIAKLVYKLFTVCRLSVVCVHTKKTSSWFTSNSFRMIWKVWQIFQKPGKVARCQVSWSSKIERKLIYDAPIWWPWTWVQLTH